MKDYINQIWDLTGNEPPLTPEDIRTAVQYAYGGWPGEFLLAGGDKAETVRAQRGGCAGWPTDHYSVSTHCDRDGVLIRVQEHAVGRAERMRRRPPPPPTAVRVGRLTWRQVEDVLRAGGEPEQLELEVI